jgi:hypothetical protein
MDGFLFRFATRCKGRSELRDTVKVKAFRELMAQYIHEYSW